jgi:hypothetical protein
MNIAQAISCFMAHLRWQLFCVSERSTPEQTSATERVLHSLDHDAQHLAANQQVRRRCAALRQILRQTPYWKSGHIEFAELCLEQDDVASAYASLQAAQALPSTARQALQIQHLMARCFLKRGNPEKARELLLPLWTQCKQVRVAEDLAAAFMALENETDALKILEACGDSKLSASSKAALDYLRLKGVGTNNNDGNQIH